MKGRCKNNGIKKERTSSLSSSWEYTLRLQSPYNEYMRDSPCTYTVYIVNRQIGITMLHKPVQSVVKGTLTISILNYFPHGVRSGSSRSGNPVSRSSDVCTDGAARFLFFSFLRTSRPAAGCCAEFAYARTTRHAMEFTRRDTSPKLETD